MYFGANPILIAAAVIPAIILLIRIYKADRLEKEPLRLIAALIIQGIVSTALASFAERLGITLLSLFLREGTRLFNAILYFGIVAFAEEGFKYLFLRRKTWNSREFNCQFDGVVYAVTVALGFALWENIGYVLMYGIFNAFVRAVTAVPGHACFGVFMGAFYGMAKRYDMLGMADKSQKCRRLAVLVPALLHGCYDYIASSEADGITLLFIVFIAAMFWIASKMVRRLSQKDRYIVPQNVYWM